MSRKKHGQLTTSPEWARYLPPFLRRFFWKGERRAERELARSATCASANRPAAGTVEDLIRQVESWAPEASSAELWVPEHLTLDGRPVPQDVGLAIIVDKLLGLSFFPDGFSRGTGGTVYRYLRE
jgi:hypothetical protein